MQTRHLECERTEHRIPVHYFEARTFFRAIRWQETHHKISFG